MRAKLIVKGLLVVCVMACGVRQASAQSAGAFHPATSGDAPYIIDWGYELTNTDTASSHDVTAHA